MAPLGERRCDERDQDRERRQPERPVRAGDEARCQRDRREEPGGGLGRAPSLVLVRGRGACSRGWPRPACVCGSGVTTVGPAPRPRSPRPAAPRPVGSGLEPSRSPGAFEGLRLGLDRPVADPGEVEDRQLQDQHHEDQLDHTGSVRQVAAEISPCPVLSPRAAEVRVATVRPRPRPAPAGLALGLDDPVLVEGRVGPIDHPDVVRGGECVHVHRVRFGDGHVRRAGAVLEVGGRVRARACSASPSGTGTTDHRSRSAPTTI